MVGKRNALLLLILCALLGLATWWLLTSRRKQPEAAVADRPRLAPGVQLRDVTFFSQALGRNMEYRVFLPENAGRLKLPVVYLLHGGGGTFRNWSNYTDVAQFAGSNLLLVMPQGDYSYYTNAVLRPPDRYEDYIVDDLPADVEGRFPARSDRASRAIVGVSMGGFGAIKLALRHPEKYAFAGGLSAAIDVPRRPFSWRRLNQSRNFRELFGPEGSETRRANDPFHLLSSADAKTVPYLYLTCGRQEGLLAPNREFAALLGRHRFAYEFHEVSGGHNWDQWNAELPGLFESLRSALAHPSSSLSQISVLRFHLGLMLLA
ncbi:MAG TPA: alpha/beta hydrolase family protein [Candidatus Angelobacter sp.]|nr:alpha/beta hydrolase family protein [Candidatus Angelobacter sp.]